MYKTPTAQKAVGVLSDQWPDSIFRETLRRRCQYDRMLHKPEADPRP